MGTYLEDAKEMFDKTPKDGHALLGLMVMAQYQGYSNTTQTLLDNLMQQNKALQAELAAIREGVVEAYSHSWIPQKELVITALYPLPSYIAEFIEEDAEL